MTINATPSRRTASLIERAAEVYDFQAALRRTTGASDVAVIPAEAGTHAATQVTPENTAPSPGVDPGFRRGDGISPQATVHVDMDALREGGFIVPDARASELVEEFRLVKRQLLKAADNATGRRILICSARPGDGKTFCAINLALSLASERDSEVLLVDADVAKPSVLSTLGLSPASGLLDALADPAIDAERLVIRTDIDKLSVLAAGTHANNATELLASARTRMVIDALASAHPRRIVLFDSAPVLAASPAAVLAQLVGQVVMVVRADRTGESELRDALGLIDGADVKLLLNGVSYFGSNRKFGSYYGLGDES